MSNVINDSYSSIYTIPAKELPASKGTVDNYYKKISGKFNDLNFTVGNSAKGANGSSGFGNVIISPEYLKKAASDPKIAAELENTVSGIPDAVNWLKNSCKMKGIELLSCAFSIDKDGGVSSWSYTRSTSGETKNDAMKPSESEGKTILAQLMENIKKYKDKNARYEEYKEITGSENTTEQVEIYKQNQATLLPSSSFNLLT
jgi:hypothetical protein